MRIHLDTDFGGDPDDAAALVALLGRPDVEVTGITTNLEVEGRRAGCASHYLGLAGRDDIEVAAGAPQPDVPERYAPTWGDERHWPDPVAPRPGDPDLALDLLDRSIAVGATICTIGALTNLARLTERDPGRLRGVRIVTMGGWVDPFAPDLPPWGPERDFNVQVDVAASYRVLTAGAEITLVQLPAAARAQLRKREIDRLRDSGPLGDLVARQSLAHATAVGHDRLGRAYDGLADDLVNFHWDPVTAAAAVGWRGATTVPRRLRIDVDPDGVLHMTGDPSGIPVDVVDRVDGDAFSDWWLAAVEWADAYAQPA